MSSIRKPSTQCIQAANGLRYPQLRYRKIKLEIQEVQGRNCLSDFHGMSLTRDKLQSLIRKWHTMIEARERAHLAEWYVTSQETMFFIVL